MDLLSSLVHTMRGAWTGSLQAPADCVLACLQRGQPHGRGMQLQIPDLKAHLHCSSLGSLPSPHAPARWQSKVESMRTLDHTQQIAGRRTIVR